MAISIFLGFRNNTAYSRFWEGRTLWGSLINVSRSFIRQILTLISLPPLHKFGQDNGDHEQQLKKLSVFQQDIIYLVIAFAHALRHHLRDSKPFPELEQYLTPTEVAYIKTQNNLPYAILHLIGQRLQQARQRQWLNDFHLPVLEDSLSQLTNILGACERIKNTPIPFTYTVLSHRIVAFFCFFLPFGIVDTVGIFTPFVVFLVSHAFFGLDVIGEEVEDPFGTSPHHLPLSALSRTIEINVRQMVGEVEVPKPLVPTNGVLS